MADSASKDPRLSNWLVREIEQPKGFVLSEELFPVTVKEQGQVIEIKIANKLIRGSVTLTKYDADYPENKLSGAVFEVYRDVNGNKALDKDDVLLGTMEESSAGVYWMKNLEYGGVLVREKTAPEGFYSGRESLLCGDRYRRKNLHR